MDLRSDYFIMIEGTLQESKKCLWKALKNAYKLTQILRGHLFFTIDSLLGQNFNYQEDASRAHSLVKDFIEFVVAWMRWMAENP